MTKPVGTIDLDSKGRTRQWLRCPVCGDSTHRPWVAHAVVNLADGILHCFRCDTTQVLEGWVPRVGLDPTPAPQRPKALRPPRRGPGNARPSALERWHRGPEDVFFSTSGGELRVLPSGKKMATGPVREGLGLGRWLTLPLLSSAERPLVVVEGPYDVLDGFTDVCIWGAVPTAPQLRLLEGCFLILRPDGDVWTNPLLRRSWLKRWASAKAIIIGVDIIPDDPDSLLDISEVTRVSLNTILRRYSNDSDPRHLNRGGSPGGWQVDPDQWAGPSQHGPLSGVQEGV